MSSFSKYKFADFTFDLSEGILRQNDEILPIKPKNLRVLALLLENAGGIVRKEEFFEKVWTDAFVADNNLTVAVAQIRKALGETKDNKFIETIPKKGYRFVASVERVSDESANPEETFTDAVLEKSTRPNENLEPADEENYDKNIPSRTSAKTYFGNISSRIIWLSAGLIAVLTLTGIIWRQNAPPERETLKSIAVLPLAVENPVPESRIFTKKLTEDLTRNLGRITDIRVASYGAAAKFDSPDYDWRQIAEELRVEGFVTGKIKGADDGTITKLEIKIGKFPDGAIIWEKNYAFDERNLNEMQYRVARDIARKFGEDKEIKNSSAEVTDEVFQLYLLGRHHLGRETAKDYEKAIEHFSAAIAKQPSFADAYAGLATTHILNGQSLYAAQGLSTARESFPAAKLNAMRALEIDSASDEALTALGFVNYRLEYDWANAEANFKRAIEINPNNFPAHRWYGEFLHKIGRFEEGFAAQRNALALAPNSPRVLNEIAWGNYLARRFDEAVKYIEAAQKIEADNAAALYNASEIYEHKKDYAQAVAFWTKAMIIEDANQKWIAAVEDSFQNGDHKEFTRAKIGWLENMAEKDYIYPTDLAKGYAALGEKQKAVEWLRKALDARTPDLSSIKYALAFDNLRDERDFQQIIGQMNFPQ